MFKLLGLFCALFVGASASASAPSLSILRQGVTYNCDPQTPPETSEDWSCSTEETDRNAELLEYGCRGDASWACVVTVKESCHEKYSGVEKNYTQKEFRGCSSSLSDCW